jgi:hypothetical protein
MNKIIQAHLLILLIVFLHNFSTAQNNSTRAVEFKPISTVVLSGHQIQLNETDPNQEIKNTTPTEEKKENIVLKQTTSPNKVAKPTTTTSAANKTTENKSVVTDKHNNPIPQYTTRQVKNENINAEKNVSETVTVNDETYKTVVTYPDLQVTATQEIITPAKNIGTERQPNISTTIKSTSKDQPTPTTKSSSKIGKVEFLKQYVEELKMLIEKNKNDPNYPLAAKQKELEDIENLLKQE